MKVAYLLGTLNRGGTETLLLDVINSSQSAPFGIIGIYRNEGTLSDSFRAAEVPVFRLTPGPVFLVWLYLFRLRKLLIRENVNVVHAQQSLDAVYACLATIGLPVKVAQTFHSFDFSLSLLSRLLIQLSLKMVDVTIFVSDVQRHFYMTKYNSKKNYNFALVYNGINFNKFNGIIINSIRKELGIHENSYLFGMVGNFVIGHDQITICHFLALLVKQDIEFTFLFIGGKDESNPQLFDNCKSYCANNDLQESVFFLGSRSDVPGILPQLDAFFYASDHDTFGISVIEAIATGIPVFINDWKVMKEITENGERAILYRTKDESDLLDKFSSYYERPETYIEKSLENATWAIQTYSIKSHIEQLFGVYNSLK